MPDTVPGSGGQVEKGEYMEFRLRYSLFHREIKRFINYGIKFAVYGDFSRYTSKPLKDFIYESNHGKDVFFTSDWEETVKRLTGIR